MVKKTQVTLTDEERQNNRIALRKYVRIFYDLQRLRLQTGGRVKARAGEIELFDVDKAALAARESGLLALEKSALKDVESCLKRFSFYRDVLKERPRYKGLGPTMAGVILSEFDIHKADSPSKFWAFSGLAVIKGTDKEGNEVMQRQKLQKGVKAPYNTFLKAKLVGVLTGCLLKAKSPWRAYYFAKKTEYFQKSWGTSPMHRHRAAMRYMVKMLLVDIWRQWRRHEGLVIKPTYSEATMGLHGYEGGDGADPYDWCSKWIEPAKSEVEELENDAEVSAELETASQED